MTPERATQLQEQFAPILDPLSRGYAYAMRLRAALFLSGKRPSWQPPRPCISVGNLAWGGTGKTPVVSWLLEWARDEGHVPVVLTRGYGGKPPRLPYEVELLSPPREAGDEPLLLKRAHPHARILTDPDRVRAGKAAARGKADIFILDDGYQHLAIRRDVNLCLFSPRDLEDQWDRVIPAGSWREDVSALSRADAFLINNTVDEDGCLETLARIRLIVQSKPIFLFRVQARGLTNALTGQTLPSLRGQRFILVTGIANPKKVYKTCIADLGANPVRHLIYPDHHFFSPQDWRVIAETAESSQCTQVVCTPKDAVKLAALADERLWVPQLTTVFTSTGHLGFRAWLENRLHSLPRSTHVRSQETA